MIDEVRRLRLWGSDLTQKLEHAINGFKREKELRESAELRVEATKLEFSRKYAAAAEAHRLSKTELDKLKEDYSSLEVFVIKKKQEAIARQNVIAELTQNVKELEAKAQKSQDELYVFEEECNRMQKVNEALTLEADKINQALALNAAMKAQAEKLEDKVGIRAKGRGEDPQDPNAETGVAMAELKDDLDRTRKALKKVSDNLVIAKNQVWNAIVMLAASGTQTCDSTWELPVREDQVKNKVSGRSYLTLLRAAKLFYHELLLVKQQKQALNQLLSTDNLSQAYFTLLADFAMLVKRLLVANLGSFPEHLPADPNGKWPCRVSGTCPIQRGDFKYWKSIVFDFLEISSAVPEDGVQPESSTAFQVEDRFGLARNGLNRWFDLQEVDNVIDRHREYAKKHEGDGHGVLGCIPLVIGMRFTGTEPLEKMVLMPKRVLNTWVHGSPELVKDIVAYLRVMEHMKMDFWENQYRSKGVFEFKWQNFFSQMEERAKDRPRSIHEGGGSWLALRNDIQKSDPPRKITWSPDNEQWKRSEGGDLGKCKRCTEIGCAESKFFEQLNTPQKVATAVSQDASSSKSDTGNSGLGENDMASSGPGTMGSPNAAGGYGASKTGNDKEVQQEVLRTEVEENDAGREIDEGWKKTENRAFIEFKEAEESERGQIDLCKCTCNTDGGEGDYGDCKQCLGGEKVKEEGKGREQEGRR